MRQTGLSGPPSVTDMFSFTLLVTVLCSGPVLLGSVPAVEDPYEAAVRALSPERSVRALFKALQARVQCGGVPCGKVGFIGPRGQVSQVSRVQPDSGCRTEVQAGEGSSPEPVRPPNLGSGSQNGPRTLRMYSLFV